jgi:hypothetical protein
MNGFIDHLYTPLGTTLYISLTHTDWYPQSITVSITRFLVTDFNTGTKTSSLKYASKILRCYNTHKVFSSQPDFQLSTDLLTSQSSSTAASRDSLSSSRYIASGRHQRKTPFPNNSSVVTEVCLPHRCIETVFLRFLLAYSFLREPVYRVVPQQRTSTLFPLFRLSGIISQY